MHPTALSAGVSDIARVGLLRVGMSAPMCMDCRWFRAAWAMSWRLDHECGHPLSVAQLSGDPLIGPDPSVNVRQTCEEFRLEGQCGRDGRFFEPRGSWWSRLVRVLT